MRIELDDEAVGIAPRRYLYLPTIDTRAPSLEHLQAGVEFMVEEIRHGGGVYVHCGAGVGRAPAMTAAYLVSTGLTPDEAWAKIREVRPFIEPKPEQVARIERFAEHQD
jgi:protein phosphatase